MNLRADPKLPGVVRIEGDASGPRVVMFAGTHGDEISGIHAADKLLFDFQANFRTLRRGTLTLVRVNAAAIAAERRYLVHNVNRLFRDDYGPEIDRDCYEFKRVQELKPLLRGCDYFLDLHSAPIAQEPFLVAERHAAGFYAGLGLPYIVMGWGRFGGPIAGDAENYANAHGAKAATLESGSHFEKRSNDVAYATVLRMLALLGMIDQRAHEAPGPARLVDMYAVVVKEADDFRYVGEAANFKALARGEAFAHQDGRSLSVAEDSYLLIPMKPEETRRGEEVCYLGRRVDGEASHDGQPVSDIDPATVKAYAETEYHVRADPPFTLRIGAPSAELAALHRARGVACSAFLTAWNPRSRALDRASNDARLATLEQELAAAGSSIVAGIGRHPDDAWPGEESFLVPGMSLDQAKRCAERFGQDAIVWSGSDAVPELVLLR